LNDNVVIEDYGLFLGVEIESFIVLTIFWNARRWRLQFFEGLNVVNDIPKYCKFIFLIEEKLYFFKRFEMVFWWVNEWMITFEWGDFFLLLGKSCQERLDFHLSLLHFSKEVIGDDLWR
jgi:hypothetical protein